MVTSDIKELFQSIIKEPVNVLFSTIKRSEYIPLDLSRNNPDLDTINTSSSRDLGQYIFEQIASKKGRVGYGGYNETRSIYERSDYFNKQTPDEKRNIHIGLDLWIDSGTSIFAPFDGVIHSLKNNTNHGDYGPTIILHHEIEGIKFHTLYGHLSIESLTDIKVGKKFRGGEEIAKLGDESVNGDYPPHLHFQVISDLQGNVGDYPGVTNKKDLDFYLRNCPDPNLLLKIP